MRVVWHANFVVMIVLTAGNKFRISTCRHGAQALRHAYFTVPLAEQLGVSCTADRSVEGWC